MIFLNKLEAGKRDGQPRWIIESDSTEPMQRMVLSQSELDRLVETTAFRVAIVAIEKGSTGLVAKTAGGKEIHLAFSNEVPEVVAGLRALFATELNEEES